MGHKSPAEHRRTWAMSAASRSFPPSPIGLSRLTCRTNISRTRQHIGISLKTKRNETPQFSKSAKSLLSEETYSEHAQYEASVCVCVCVCACVRACVCACVRVYTRAFVLCGTVLCVCARACARACVYVRTFVLCVVCVCVRACVFREDG